MTVSDVLPEKQGVLGRSMSLPAFPLNLSVISLGDVSLSFLSSPLNTPVCPAFSTPVQSPTIVSVAPKVRDDEQAASSKAVQLVQQAADNFEKEEEEKERKQDNV